MRSGPYEITGSGPAGTSVDLLHLVEAQLDGNLPLEDVHEHLELLLVGVHVDDLAVEVGQRP